jgi:hypothetical protein
VSYQEKFCLLRILPENGEEEENKKLDSRAKLQTSKSDRMSDRTATSCVGATSSLSDAKNEDENFGESDGEDETKKSEVRGKRRRRAVARMQFDEQISEKGRVWRASDLGTLPVVLGRAIMSCLDNVDLACMYVTSSEAHRAVADHFTWTERVQLLPAAEFLILDTRFPEATRLSCALPHMYPSRCTRIAIVAKWDALLNHDRDGRFDDPDSYSDYYNKSRDRILQYLGGSASSARKVSHSSQAPASLTQSNVSARLVAYIGDWSATSIELLEALASDACNALATLHIVSLYTNVYPIVLPDADVCAKTLRKTIESRHDTLTELDLDNFAHDALAFDRPLTLPDMTDLLDATTSANRFRKAAQMRVLRLVPISERFLIHISLCDWSRLRVLHINIVPILRHYSEKDRVLATHRFVTCLSACPLLTELCYSASWAPEHRIDRTPLPDHMRRLLVVMQQGVDEQTIRDIRDKNSSSHGPYAVTPLRLNLLHLQKLQLRSGDPLDIYICAPNLAVMRVQALTPRNVGLGLQALASHGNSNNNREIIGNEDNNAHLLRVLTTVFTEHDDDVVDGCDGCDSCDDSKTSCFTLDLRWNATLVVALHSGSLACLRVLKCPTVVTDLKTLRLLAANVPYLVVLWIQYSARSEELAQCLRAWPFLRTLHMSQVTTDASLLPKTVLTRPHSTIPPSTIPTVTMPVVALLVWNVDMDNLYWLYTPQLKQLKTVEFHVSNPNMCMFVARHPHVTRVEATIIGPVDNDFSTCVESKLSSHALHNMFGSGGGGSGGADTHNVEDSRGSADDRSVCNNSKVEKSGEGGGMEELLLEDDCPVNATSFEWLPVIARRIGGKLRKLVLHFYVASAACESLFASLEDAAPHLPLLHTLDINIGTYGYDEKETAQTRMKFAQYFVNLSRLLPTLTCLRTLGISSQLALCLKQLLPERITLHDNL